MEQARKEYKILTNREPGRMFYLGGEASQALVETFADRSLEGKNEYEFVDIIKTGGTLQVIKIADVHKKSGVYSGSSILLGSSCSMDVVNGFKDLKDGEYVTLVMCGKNLAEIAQKRKKIFRVDESDTDLVAKRDAFFGTLDELAVTDGFLARHPNHVYHNSDGSAAALGFNVPKQGLHMRPSGMIVKCLSPYNCEAYLRNIAGNPDKLKIANPRSVMNLLVSEFTSGNLICAARGPEAYPAIRDLAKIVRSSEFY